MCYTTFYLHIKCFYKPLYDLLICDFWVLLLLTEQGVYLTVSQMQLLMNSFFHTLNSLCICMCVLSLLVVFAVDRNHTQCNRVTSLLRAPSFAHHQLPKIDTALPDRDGKLSDLGKNFFVCGKHCCRRAGAGSWIECDLYSCFKHSYSS